jgi:ABC-2 type transport system ATP-binding protein
MDVAIAISAVTRRFGKAVAVNRLSLEVRRGEIFALVGPDGAGKTTLIRLICGALRLDEGSLQLDGIDVAADAARVQATVGYMPQRFSLYPDLSVIENLRFYGEIFGVPAAAFASRSSDLLKDFGLLPFGSRLAEELSGGMKQKLALACTLIHTPATILLDEPTAGVDPLSRREFWRILYRINRRGTTIFVSTPYMDEAERANRVALIMGGSVVDCGTPDQLKQGLRGDVVEVACDQRSLARRTLREDPAVRSVEIFGTTLHALVDSAAAAVAEMERRLRDSGVENARLRKVEPSLEDAFVARLAS